MAVKKKLTDEQRLQRKQTQRLLAIGIVLGGSIVYSVGVYLLIGTWGGTSTITPKNLSKLPLASRLQAGDANLSNDEVRAAALQLDQQLFDAREAMAHERAFSGRLDKPYQGWYQRTSFLENELKEVQNPPENSLEWHMQRELERLQQDKPSR